MCDPRAFRLKELIRGLAEKKDMLEEFELFEQVERRRPLPLRGKARKKVLRKRDLYSGLV